MRPAVTIKNSLANYKAKDMKKLVETIGLTAAVKKSTVQDVVEAIKGNIIHESALNLLTKEQMINYISKLIDSGKI